MVYAVSTVTRAQSKVQKRANSMWVCIQGVYSVQKIGIGGVIRNVKYEKKTERQKIVKKRTMTKKRVIIKKFLKKVVLKFFGHMSSDEFFLKHALMYVLYTFKGYFIKNESLWKILLFWIPLIFS